MALLILALLEHPEHTEGVKNCLSEAGYTVCIVTSFAKAIAVLQVQSVDLILSDVHLENGGSVFDFLRWVKEDPNLKKIPFVLFSLEPSNLAKYLADGVLTTARYFGAAKYISMDTFDPAVLNEEVAKLLPINASDQNIVPQTG